MHVEPTSNPIKDKKTYGRSITVEDEEEENSAEDELHDKDPRKVCTTPELLFTVLRSCTENTLSFLKR